MEFSTTIWNVRWKIHRHGAEKPESYHRRFRTAEGAQKKTRELISTMFSHEIAILPYLEELRKGPHASYRAAMADFIKKLLLSGAFLESKSQIPCFLPQAYPPDTYNQYRDMRIWRDDAGNRIEDSEIDTDPNKFVMFGSRRDPEMTFEYPRRAYPKIHTDIFIVDTYRRSSFSFTFRFANKELLEYGQISEFSVTLTSGYEKNKSSYAAQILELLRRSDTPLKQHKIAGIIGIDRKTVWRNINALIAAGTNIQKDEHNAYYLPHTKTGLSYTDIELIKNSIEINPNITADEKERLIELLYKM